MFRIARNTVDEILSLLYLPHCPGCEKPLVANEKSICWSCLTDIEETGFHNRPQQNDFYLRVAGLTQIEGASSMFYYDQGSKLRRIVMELKYKGIFGIGRRLGRHCGQALIGSPLLQDIDVVVPIPLHRSRLVERGYNQAEEIAKGFCEVTGIRMDNKSISRFRRTHTQTKKGKADRWESMSTVFRINEPLNGGVLLLDDVMTTGSTLVGCASVLNRQVIRPACVKLFTVGMTRSFK